MFDEDSDGNGEAGIMGGVPVDQFPLATSPRASAGNASDADSDDSGMSGIRSRGRRELAPISTKSYSLAQLALAHTSASKGQVGHPIHPRLWPIVHKHNYDTYMNSHSLGCMAWGTPQNT